MKIFWAFVKKEIYHILRDKRTLFILFGMPLAQILIFGYAVTNEFKEAPVAVLDQAKDELSRELVLHLQASGHFNIVQSAGQIGDLEQGFRNGSLKMGIVIPPDFSTSFYRDKEARIQLIADGTEPNYATTLISYAHAMVLDFQQEKQPKAALPVQLDVKTRMMYNPSLESTYNFIPGTIAIILLLISAMMTALTIAREKEMGTMEILLVSPMPPILIILGKVTPYAMLSFLNAVGILALGVFVFGVPIRGNLALLLGLCGLYVLTALALGTLISTRAANQQVAMLASLVGLLMPSMLLSGFLFPFTSMPAVLQVMGHIMPAYYFIDILRSVMLKGSGLHFIWQSTAVLGGMTLFLLLLSWKNFKIRLE